MMMMMMMVFFLRMTLDRYAVFTYAEVNVHFRTAVTCISHELSNVHFLTHTHFAKIEFRIPLVRTRSKIRAVSL